MSLLHKLRGIFIDEFELKKDISNMIAVSIFMDSIVRPAEVKKGYEILENLFNGEDYDYLKDEVDLLLEDFQKDAVFYIESREKAIEYIKNNKQNRKELIEIIKLIFRSDHDMHKKESEMLNILDKETNSKKGNDDEI